MKPKEKVKRKPTKIEAWSTLVILLVMVVFAVRVNVNVVPVLVLGTIWAAIIGWRCGFTWKDIEGGIINRIGGLIGVLLIFLSIGFMISAFMFSGTIPVFIYYLLKIVDPRLIIVLSFVLCSLVACAIGTSWGTAGTIGVVMIGLAQTMGVSIPIVAGAVISGSHVGQIISPMADMTNLATNISGTDLIASIKRTCYYAIPIIIICIVLYAILGFTSPITNASTESIEQVTGAISQIFNTNPVVILPLIILLGMCVMKKPVSVSLIVSGLIAIVIGAIFNGFGIDKGLTVAYAGFNLTTVTGIDAAEIAPAVVTLVNRGGMTSMGNTLITMFCAMAYAGVMIAIGSIEVIVESAFKNVTSRTGLAVSAVLIGIITALATVSSYLTLLMPGDLLKKKYVENGYHPTNLASISQSVGAIIMPVIPWGATAVYMAGIAGVTVYEFMPWAFFCYGSCIVAIVTAALKFGYVGLSEDEQREMLSTMQ